MPFLSIFNRNKEHSIRVQTLALAFDSGKDNFLLLRFIAAALVIFGHSYAISGIPGAGDFIARAGWGENLYTGSIAVDVFFVVSGFLVTSSYLRRDSLQVFLKSRLLRVLPAYAACLLITAFVLGALYTELPLLTYWTLPQVRNYFIINLKLGADLLWTLPGVFVHNPYPNTVNGSIWTLPAEVRMYIAVAIFGLVGILQRRWLVNVVFLILLLMGIFKPRFLPFSANLEYVRLAGFFLAGAACYLNRDYIPLSSRLLVFLIGVAWLMHSSIFFRPLFDLALIYSCFWFAYRPNLYFFNQFGDYSYGLYLWGFPIQQAVAHAFGEQVQPMLIFLWSLPLTLIVAIASWHGIEQPALRLKSKFTRLAAQQIPA